MKRFEEIGIVERHEFRDSRAHYEKASKAHHDHLIDMATGRVVEFRSAEIERLQEEIAERLGFRLIGHRLELYGVPLTNAEDRCLAVAGPESVGRTEDDPERQEGEARSPVAGRREGGEVGSDHRVRPARDGEQELHQRHIHPKLNAATAK
jgi:Ferric uptake regulator family